MEKLHIETPLIESVRLSKLVPGSVWLKVEALQPASSFKLRGIGNVCQHYLAQGAKRFVSSSGGNATKGNSPEKLCVHWVGSSIVNS